MTTIDPGKAGFKTLGIRLPDGLHTQLVLVAQLDGLNLNDAAKKAVELYVQSKRAEGDFAARATEALAEIEREAAARRSAIEGLFGSPESDAAETATPAKEGQPSRRAAKTGEAPKD